MYDYLLLLATFLAFWIIFRHDRRIFRIAIIGLGSIWGVVIPFLPPFTWQEKILLELSALFWSAGSIVLREVADRSVSLFILRDVQKMLRLSIHNSIEDRIDECINSKLIVNKNNKLYCSSSGRVVAGVMAFCIKWLNL